MRVEMREMTSRHNNLLRKTHIYSICINLLENNVFV